MTEKLPKASRVEFRGRLVADHYPARHEQAQSITVYNDFRDGVSRDRIKYGDPKDRYPGGITYATAEERIAYRINDFRDHLANKHRYSQHSLMITYQVYGEGSPEQIEERIRAAVAKEEIRTDHRCADCDVEVGEFHLPGCDSEVCPKCTGQALGCDCTGNDDDDEEDPADDSDKDLS